MIPEDDASKLADRLAEATQRVASDYRDEDVIDEESFSSQLCGRLKETIHAYETDSFVWQVETEVADRGHGRFKARSLGKIKEEPLYGADLIMVIEATSPDLVVKKGFLAQAKRLESGKYLNTSDYRDLHEQCHAMLMVTSASYVFLYSSHGVHVVSANAVVASLKRDLWSLPTWPIDILYYDFAICWLGDYRLRTTTRRSLEDLRAANDANAAVRVLGKPKLFDGPPRRRQRV